ncbi:DsbE family thiol:disulfide interchange protein [Aestuariivirga litoralis]|uniref:DsbE family thiol:disulfide interchange protein n=1 Tax=Aestuariivirga litoralis TaxID=2650924 RepID=A0A2W2ATZ6_9HYPH|nr:DsbE family thiol:disulfide interchange protein [Aestuariivirga litoralis]PZF77172.1 DsbE family thiol:disulfide interchange protein [Aestuariivirga litoralis]
MSTAEAPEKRSRLWLVLLPVIVFAALAALFWKGLSGTPNQIPSALINKPVPDFVLNAVPGLNVPGFDDETLKQGKVTVVNVWASWCAPCRIEHPLLTELARRPDIQLFGMNYKDEPQNAVEFLSTLGQPFAAVGMDRDGRTGIDWGVYGVPETFIVDGQGMIRYKHIGPLTPEAIAGEMAREIEKAKAPLAGSGS